MGNFIHIAAGGARTPLGLGASSTAAAIRAGIKAISEHPFMVDQVGDPMPAAIDAQLDAKIMGPKRFLGLAESALRETCEPFKTGWPLSPKLPLFLGLPELRPGFTKDDVEIVRSGLLRIDGLPVTISEIVTFTQGHAAGLVALAAAIEKMRMTGLESCIVGGIDSYFQPDTMEWLDANRQLCGSVSRSGFIPGEGAGFFLLANEPVRFRLKLPSFAVVNAVAIGRETKLIKTEEICLGDGLTSTVRESIGFMQESSEKVNDIICDINGERYRSEEWAFVCLRLGTYFDDIAAYRSPAECWGDMGAASVPLFAVLLCQAVARGYAKGRRTLLWASSESGHRGAAILETLKSKGS